MNTFFNYLICFVLFFSIATNAQIDKKYSGLFSIKCNNSGFNLNLKDSIKTVYVKFNQPKKSLSKYNIILAIANNFVVKYSYLNFDEYQRIVELVDIGYIKYEYLSTENIKSDSVTKYKYLYSKNDFLKKSKYKTALKQYYPVYNRNLLLKLDQTEIFDREINGKKQPPDYMSAFNVYKFEKDGKIIEEKTYSDRFASETQKKSPSEENLNFSKLFLYNDKGQVINQKIIAGTKNIDYGSTFSNMGVSCRFCDDLQLQYEYDSLGRITQIVMFGCKTTVSKEEYTYHPTQDYVETVKIYNKEGSPATMGRRNIMKTFNEHGDVINIKALIDNPSYYPQSELIKNQKYYSYEYDSHNNWIKCKMYLEGTNEGEPTLVAERKIEYYQ